MKLQHLRNYWFLLRTFRNGWQLIDSIRHDAPCGEAQLRGGGVIVHPPERGGLVGTILELWREQCYTPSGFYQGMQDEGVVVDAGAHVGLFSRWMSRQNPHRRIIALEPFQENYDCLTANLQSTEAGNVEAYRMGVGGAVKVGCMEAVGQRSIDHLLRPADRLDESSFPVLTLADILEMVGDSRISFFKLDVEGAERELFEIAEPYQIQRIDHLAMEYHDHLAPGTLQLIQHRLADSHEVTVIPTEDRGYGVLLAKHRRVC